MIYNRTSNQIKIILMLHELKTFTLHFDIITDEKIIIYKHFDNFSNHYKNKHPHKMYNNIKINRKLLKMNEV